MARYLQLSISSIYIITIICYSLEIILSYKFLFYKQNKPKIRYFLHKLNRLFLHLTLIYWRFGWSAKPWWLDINVTIVQFLVLTLLLLFVINGCFILFIIHNVILSMYIKKQDKYRNETLYEWKYLQNHLLHKKIIYIKCFHWIKQNSLKYEAILLFSWCYQITVLCIQMSCSLA